MLHALCQSQRKCWPAMCTGRSIVALAGIGMLSRHEPAQTARGQMKARGQQFGTDLLAPGRHPFYLMWTVIFFE